VVVEEKLTGGGRSGSGHFKQTVPNRRLSRTVDSRATTSFSVTKMVTARDVAQ